MNRDMDLSPGALNYTLHYSTNHFISFNFANMFLHIKSFKLLVMLGRR